MRTVKGLSRFAVILVGLTALLLSVGGPAFAEGREHDGHHNDAVRLAPEVLREFGVEVREATAHRIVRTVVLPAEVRANEDRLAHIAPRFSGIVQDVHKSVGDEVVRGDTLAIIESNESLAPYSLKTELSGVVIARHVTRGEPVNRDIQAFVVADLSQVWVNLSVYQKDLNDIALGQRVVISAGHGREEQESTISYVAPILDEATRTGTARVVLANESRSWRPGMFVTASVTIEDVEVPLAVERTAIEVIDGEQVVFVGEGDAFVAHVVVLGRRDEHYVEVLEGLSEGEKYVARGGFTLKAELQRDELSGGHEH